MFIVLIGLGTWQLERKTWKEGLIAALAARTSAEPVALPAPERWSALDPASDEFRRVAFTAIIASGRVNPLVLPPARARTAPKRAGAER